MVKKRARKDHFICSVCEQELHKDLKMIKSGKNYCKACLDKLEQIKLLEQNLIRDLVNYLKLDNVPGMILSQIKKYVEEYNYTYTGISYTIWYYTEVLNKEYESQYGIGFVKYYYNEAKDYFLNLQELEDSIPKEIKIKPKFVEIKSKKKKDIKNLYDLSSMLKEIRDE